jgi:hypothetical protein
MHRANISTITYAEGITTFVKDKPWVAGSDGGLTIDLVVVPRSDVLEIQTPTGEVMGYTHLAALDDIKAAPRITLSHLNGDQQMMTHIAKVVVQDVGREVT